MKKTATKVIPEAQGKTLLIAAGGTGGHITPGISIAEHWLNSGGNIILATLMKNIDYPDIVRLARNENVTIVAYDAPRLTKNPLQLPAFFRRFRSAYKLVKQAATAEGANAVLGMGGYSSFPAVAYAVLNRKPLFLCEQNAHCSYHSLHYLYCDHLHVEQEQQVLIVLGKQQHHRQGASYVG